jgi:hypothetical protein
VRTSDLPAAAEEAENHLLLMTGGLKDTTEEEDGF